MNVHSSRLYQPYRIVIPSKMLMNDVFLQSAKMYLVGGQTRTPIIRKRIIRFLESVYVRQYQRDLLAPFLQVLKHPTQLVSKKMGKEIWEFICNERADYFRYESHEILLYTEFYAPLPMPNYMPQFPFGAATTPQDSLFSIV